MYVQECEECGRIRISQDNVNWGSWTFDETAVVNSHHTEADFDTVDQCTFCEGD